MVSALPISFLKKILPSALVARIDFFSNIFTRLPAVLHSDFGDILANIINNVFNGNVDEALKKMGKLAILIPKSLLDKITSKLIPFQQYFNCIKRKPFFRPFKTIKCIGNTFIKSLPINIKPVIRLVKNVANVLKSIRRIFRGRDTASSTSCADIQSLGSSALQLEPYELEEIATDEFMKCLSELSSYHEWSVDQLNVLKLKLMTGFSLNDTSQIDDDILYKINNLALAFTDREIASWKINSLDTLSTLGSIENFNSSQVN